VTTNPVRRAGRFEVPEQHQAILWSVADGRRGRRWRWVVSRGSDLTIVHTLELDPAGDFSRLESATADAMLTLHREADFSIHGNRIDRHGVEHITIDAAPLRLLVDGDEGLGLAALVTGLAIAEPAQLRFVRVSVDLRVGGGTATVAPIGRQAMRVGETEVALDADGLPVSAGQAWPLELADEPDSTSWPLERD
jgi:hypothetical protein